MRNRATIRENPHTVLESLKLSEAFTRRELDRETASRTFRALRLVLFSVRVMMRRGIPGRRYIVMLSVLASARTVCFADRGPRCVGTEHRGQKNNCG